MSVGGLLSFVIQKVADLPGTEGTTIRLSHLSSVKPPICLSATPSGIKIKVKNKGTRGAILIIAGSDKSACKSRRNLLREMN